MDARSSTSFTRTSWAGSRPGWRAPNWVVRFRLRQGMNWSIPPMMLLDWKDREDGVWQAGKKERSCPHRGTMQRWSAGYLARLGSKVGICTDTHSWQAE